MADHEQDQKTEQPTEKHVTEAIERGLRDALTVLQRRGIGAGLRLAPGAVRLPWDRTFEVDFDLESV